jgi:hypothetical protein
LVVTAQSIENRRDVDLIAQDALETIARSGLNVYATPAAQNLLNGHKLPENLSTRYSGREDLVLFAYRGDAFDEEEGAWPVNFPGASPQIFGPREINMDWYANWPSVERLVLAPPNISRQDGGKLSIDPPNLPSITAPLLENGILRIDGEHFYLERSNGERLNFLNSANPKLIISARKILDSAVEVTGIPYGDNRQDSWYVLSLNSEQIIKPVQAKREYNFNRIFQAMSVSGRDCILSLLGQPLIDALLETSMDLVELDDATLTGVNVCLGLQEH